MRPRQCWLMKTEPDTYSIDDLAREGRTCWDGVRNHRARNYMRDEMQVGDPVLFYHSSAKTIGVAGLARVSRAAYPDHTAWDENGDYFDPRSTPADPTWYMVDVEYVEKFPEIVTLAELKGDPALEGMLVTRRGMRLSVQPVEPAHYERIVQMAKGGVNAE